MGTELSKDGTPSQKLSGNIHKPEISENFYINSSSVMLQLQNKSKDVYIDFHDSHNYKFVYHTFLLLLAVAILLHNSTVVYIYKKKASLQIPANFALASTSCADALTGFFLIPFTVGSAALSNRSPELDPLYFTSNLISDFLTFAIVPHLLLVTLERYIELCHPYLHPVLAEAFKVKLVVYSIWGSGLFIASAQICWSYPVLQGKIVDISRSYRIYSIMTLIGLFFLPSISMLYCLVAMFLVVKKLRKGMARQGYISGRPLKPITMFFAMFCNMFACWSPLMFVRISIDINPDYDVDEKTLEVLFALRCCSSLLNPVIFVWCKEDFKDAFKRMFFTKASWLFIFKRQSNQESVV